MRPDRRRRGLARTLLGGILEEARQRHLRQVVLEVRPSNTEARALYESFGFRVVGRRRGYYYDTGEDSLVMEVTLARDDNREAPGGNRRYRRAVTRIGLRRASGSSQPPPGSSAPCCS